jgi:5,10-methylenetetrahydromethanopterin reductase
LVEHPIAELAVRARVFEALGYDDIWVPDERLLRNVYLSLAAAGAATERVRLGPAVTNPYTRHPALTAAAIATLDECCAGRASLALAPGGGLGAYGIERRHPVGVLREAVEIIRALTAGETLTYPGRYFTINGAHLDFPPLRQVPIYLAARGPRILQLAGEIADGVIIGGFARPEGIAFAQEMVGKGLRSAGRSRQAIRQMAWLYVSASEDREAARVAVSKQVLASITTSRPILEQIGVRLPAALASHLESTGWAYPKESPLEAAALVPEEILQAFAIYGTPEECVRRLDEVWSCGIDEMCFVLFPVAGETPEVLARRLAEVALRRPVV